jgi:hypothetical protein
MISVVISEPYCCCPRILEEEEGGLISIRTEVRDRRRAQSGTRFVICSAIYFVLSAPLGAVYTCPILRTNRRTIPCTICIQRV